MVWLLRCVALTCQAGEPLCPLSRPTNGPICRDVGRGIRARSAILFIGTLRRAAGGRQPRLLPKCEPPPARAAGHLSLRGSLLFDGLTRLRAARRRDRDPPRLHCFWNLAHQFDLQQTVLKCCSLHPHEIGEAEGAAEARAEMP